MVHLAMTKLRKTQDNEQNLNIKLQQQRLLFGSVLDLIAYDKGSFFVCFLFFKNVWNVIRRYMFKDSKKLATEKKPNNSLYYCI